MTMSKHRLSLYFSISMTPIFRSSRIKSGNSFSLQTSTFIMDVTIFHLIANRKTLNPKNSSFINKGGFPYRVTFLASAFTYFRGRMAYHNPLPVSDVLRSPCKNPIGIWISVCRSEQACSKLYLQDRMTRGTTTNVYLAWVTLLSPVPPHFSPFQRSWQILQTYLALTSFLPVFTIHISQMAMSVTVSTHLGHCLHSARERIELNMSFPPLPHCRKIL